MVGTAQILNTIFSTIFEGGSPARLKHANMPASRMKSAKSANALPASDNDKAKKELRSLLITIGFFIFLFVFLWLTGVVYHIWEPVEKRQATWLEGVNFWLHAFNDESKTSAVQKTIWTLIILWLTFTVLLGVLLYYTMPKIKAFRRNRFLKSRKASHVGTAEFAQFFDLRQYLGDDGVIIGGKKTLNMIRPVRLSARSSFEHIAVIGPTGAGKSSTFYIPNLLTLPEGVSAFVTDPKGELEEITGPTLKKRGWQIITFAPFEPELSIGYDPLRLASHLTEISDVASIILKNGYDPDGRGGDTQWITFSQPLFDALLLGVREMSKYSEEDFIKLVNHLEKNLSDEVMTPAVRSSITQFIRRFMENGQIGTVHDAALFLSYIPDTVRTEMFRYIGGDAYERALTYAQAIESPETAASIRTVVTSSVQLFGRPDISKIGYKQPLIDFSQLRKEKTVLFIRLPERKAHLLKPIMATFFWQSIEHVADVSGHPIFYFLDEFPNIGKVPGFAQMVATLRSRKIALCVAMQGIEQLAREYSEHEQKDILNNLRTKIIYPGSSGDTAQFISNLSGFSSVNKESRVELLSASEIRSFPDRQVLILVRNTPPIFLNAFHYSNI